MREHALGHIRSLISQRLPVPFVQALDAKQPILCAQTHFFFDRRIRGLFRGQHPGVRLHPRNEHAFCKKAFKQGQMLPHFGRGHQGPAARRFPVKDAVVEHFADRLAYGGSADVIQPAKLVLAGEFMVAFVNAFLDPFLQSAPKLMIERNRAGFVDFQMFVHKRLSFIRCHKRRV